MAYGSKKSGMKKGKKCKKHGKMNCKSC